MKQVCPVCKTTKFRRSTDSGLVCKYGHKLLGIQKEEGEEFTFSGRARKKVKTVREKFTLTASQQKSYEMQMIQYILQVMGRTFTQDLGFSVEVEATLRELWLLYITNSRFELSEAYMFEANEKRQDKEPKKAEDVSGLEAAGLLNDLETMGLFCDSDDEQMEDDDHNMNGEADYGGRKWPSMGAQDALAFIYLTFVYLRYPIMTNDIIMWCKTARLPYLQMQRRIPDHILGGLPLHVTDRMGRLPSAKGLKRRSYMLAKCFYANCNLEMPEYNIPLYFDRFCAHYFLPVEGYFYAYYLYKKYLRHRKSGVKPSITYSFLHQLSHPSILLACVISATKFLYSVDGSKEDLHKASRYNILVSKEAWLNKIRVNLKLWKSRLDSTNKLDFVIEMLKERSKATYLTTQPRHRYVALSNLLNTRIIEYLQHRPHMLGIFMDPPEVLNMNVDHEERPLLEEGDFYYMKQTHRPEDYCDLLKLAAFIGGDFTRKEVEIALKQLEKRTGKIEIYVKRIMNKDIYKKRYGLL
ncbi:hypothetical protein G6F43_001957 [Rhizopus delemar]|nr:hypothetical protein G6F43_001957 [Rhizopus delemar]